MRTHLRVFLDGVRDRRHPCDEIHADSVRLIPAILKCLSEEAVSEVRLVKVPNAKVRSGT